MRLADIGLLYDPGRAGEKRFCQYWRAALRARDPDLRIRFNYPYRGAADGHTTALRKRFSARHYLGIELEVNQRLGVMPKVQWTGLQRAVAEALSEAIGQFFLTPSACRRNTRVSPG
jgi:hypothetical protein